MRPETTTLRHSAAWRNPTLCFPRRPLSAARPSSTRGSGARVKSGAKRNRRSRRPRALLTLAPEPPHSANPGGLGCPIDRRRLSPAYSAGRLYGSSRDGQRPEPLKLRMRPDSSRRLSARNGGSSRAAGLFHWILAQGSRRTRAVCIPAPAAGRPWAMTASNIAWKVCRGTPSQSAQVPYSRVSQGRPFPELLRAPSRWSATKRLTSSGSGDV